MHHITEKGGVAVAEKKKRRLAVVQVADGRENLSLAQKERAMCGGVDRVRKGNWCR